MQPTGNDKPPNFPGRPASPFLVGPQSSPQFQSPASVTGTGAATTTSMVASPFSSTGLMPPVGSQTSAPFAPPGPVSGMPNPGYRPPLTNFNGPSTFSPQPSFPAQDVSGVYHPPQAPRFPPPSQPTAPLPSSPFSQPSAVPQVPFRPPPQVPSQHTPSIGAPPPSGPPFITSRPSSQPFQAYPSAPPTGMPPPVANPQFPSTRPGQHPQFVPPLAPPQGPLQPPYQPPQGGQPPTGHFPYQSSNQMQYPNAGPPLGPALQTLIEDFQSLSVGAAPGSLDPGVDVKALPRPLDVDEELPKVNESFPMNCHPRFFRLTTQAMPGSQSLLSRWHLPLAAVVHPLAEVPDGEEVPIVNFGPAGVVRCRRCRTYINPYITFANNGRQWKCNLCSLLNDVPGDYYCQFDPITQKRSDADQRPELCKGTVEFVAPTEYMVRPPMPPSYFFLIDVSVAAVQSGLLEVVAKTIKSCLNDLPRFPRTQIGFLTFDSTLHFHNLKSSLTQPQMMVVADLEDVFLPLPDDLLVNLVESRHVVDAFLDSLPNMFQTNANLESALGPAIKAAYMVMSQIGGKLLVFQSTLPSLGTGRLRLRGDDIRAYGTDKEHLLRVPEDPFYKQMAAEFTKNQIAVDLFAFSGKYCDIASLGALAKYTGGQVYHYPSFQAASHQEKLVHELTRNLTRETAWEAVMRIRCGKGVRFTTYHGHFMLRSTDLLALPAVDSDKAYAMQLTLEESLMTSETVYFQVALLYTSSSGERRIRVHTAAARVVSELSEMYRQADTGAIVSVLSRLAVESSTSGKLEDARQQLQLRFIRSLKEYRGQYAVQHRLSGRLIYPESLRYLPLYVLAMCKSLALRGGYADAPLDERCAAGCSIMVLPINRLLKFLYPAMYRIDEVLLKGSKDEPLKQLPLTVQCLDPNGMYILDDGLAFVVWLGRTVPHELVSSTLGLDSTSYADLSKVQLHELNNEASRKFHRMLKSLREKDPSTYQLVRIVRQGDQPREGFLLLSNLVEDQTAGASSYADWILQVHRQTQSQ